MIYHFAPNGTLGLVLANGSLSFNSGGEGEIRKSIVEAKLVDCIAALSDKLFYNTGIPACLWFISRDRKNHNFRDREDEILFIDVRNLSDMVTCCNWLFSDDDIERTADTCHAWRRLGKGATAMRLTGGGIGRPSNVGHAVFCSACGVER